MDILIVEDYRELAESLSEFINLLGHNAQICLDPIEALEYLKVKTFDLIICDYNMPFMNGVQFFYKVQGEGLSLAPFVFCTSDVEKVQFQIPENFFGGNNL